MRRLKDAKAWFQKGRQSSPNRHRRNDWFARSLTRLLAHKKEEGAEQIKERRERREEKKTLQAGLPAFFTGSQMGGMVEKRVRPSEICLWNLCRLEF